MDYQEESLTRYCSQVESLIDVVQQLSLARSLEAIMAIVKKAARYLTNSDGATFILQEGENCYYADEDAIAPLWKGARFPSEICIGGWTMRERTNAVIVDVAGDTRIPYEAYKPTFVKSLVTAPIRTREPIGAIGSYWAERHQPTPEEIRILQTLADSTAIAMENVQLYLELEQRVRERTAALEIANQHLKAEIVQRLQAEEEIRQLSLTDELTGLYNRRGFLWLAESVREKGHRQQQGGALFFIDLDGLKGINDTYGHEMGDRMIVATAHVLKKIFRSVDIVARLGGDEFAVFVMIDYLGDLEAIERRIQENLQELNASSSQVYQLSWSIGKIVDDERSRSTDLTTLLQQADQQMYIQKRSKKRSP
jgi:diguanylate cyclase (GGDEF)-like protein